MSVKMVVIRAVRKPDGNGWYLEVDMVGKKGRRSIHGSMSEQTSSSYPNARFAIMAVAILADGLLAEAPAGVPGVPVERWNRDGDVPSDNLTGRAS